ncbi:MAG: hypothetical protein JMN25_17960 [gamma proteobacterium endosymbiont of Lamellibrachia anaximandri]|nr:hypothetical protein [gamma proteobacterium endosymbiont of Lamellibrachia anaximandri]
MNMTTLIIVITLIYLEHYTSEFLISYDGDNEDRPNFVLTSNRLVVWDKEKESYSAFDLRDIESFVSKAGGLNGTYTLTTLDGSHDFPGLRSCPKEEIMSFAIGKARETPPWGEIVVNLPEADDEEDEPESSAPDGLFSDGLFGLLNKDPIGWIVFGLISGFLYGAYQVLQRWLSGFE